MKNKIYATILVVLTLVIVHYIAVIFWAFNEQFYKYEYEKNNSAQIINITENELWKVTELLWDYIEFSEDDLYIEIEGFNEDGYYTLREKLHMEDVRQLFKKATFLFYGSSISWISIIMINLKDRDNLINLINTYKKGYLLILTIYILGLFYLVKNFNTYFIKFHLIFFNNDLWLLNPNEDMLINMYPSQFFVDITIIIFMTIVILSCFIIFVFHKLPKYIKNK